MSISVEELECSADTHQTYKVTIFEDQINTVLTHTPSIVDNWISETLSIHHNSLNHLIVGLDIEWRPSFSRNIENPVSILQLCVGRRCLIFQLIYKSHTPQSLINFLDNPNFTFVGVGIAEDIEKLLVDHELRIATSVDLRRLAAEKLDLKELKNAGMKLLAKEILGKEIQKPKRVTMSRWDAEFLTYDQIQYACVDAFVSFEIGKRLMTANY